MEILTSLAHLGRMIKILIVAAVCFPSLVFAQASKEDYAIYSQCLKNYQKEKDKKMYFVVRFFVKSMRLRCFNQD